MKTCQEVAGLFRRILSGKLRPLSATEIASSTTYRYETRK
jgi:hypothetical protein